MVLVLPLLPTIAVVLVVDTAAVVEVTTLSPPLSSMSVVSWSLRGCSSTGRSGKDDLPLTAGLGSLVHCFFFPLTSA